jgi:hypothetical protein
MSKVILLVVASLFTFQIAAWGKKDKIKMFGEVSSFYNLNTGDIKKSQANLLHQKNTFGGSFGVGIKVKALKDFYLLLSMGLRFTPQRLSFNDLNFKEEEKFTTTDYYLRFILGYSFALSEGNRIDVGVGFQNFYALEYKRVEERLHAATYNDAGSGQTYHYLSSIYGADWGDGRSTAYRSIAPFVFNPLIHLGILNTTILPNERQMGIAFEFSTKIGNGTSNNQGYMYLLDKDRNTIANETFKDRYTAIGITLSVAIF